MTSNFDQTTSPTSVTSSISVFMSELLQAKTVDLSTNVLEIDIINDNARGSAQYPEKRAHMKISGSSKEVNRWKASDGKRMQSSINMRRRASADSILMPQRQKSPSSLRQHVNARWIDSDLKKLSAKTCDLLIASDMLSFRNDVSPTKSMDSLSASRSSRRRASLRI